MTDIYLKPLIKNSDDIEIYANIFIEAGYENYAEADFDIGKLIEIAREGDVDSQYELGQMFLTGEIVDEENDYKAIYWFRQAAKHNHLDAIRELKELGDKNE